MTDSAGGVGSDTLTVTVNSFPPVVYAGPQQTVDVNTLVLLSGTFTDPDVGETHTATIDWGDGSITPATVDQAADTVTGSHTYTTIGTKSVVVTVTDSEGTTGSGYTTIYVDYEAFQIDIGPDRNCDEGELITIVGAYSGGDPAATYTGLITWGDGDETPAVVDPVAKTMTASHAYRDNGSFLVGLFLDGSPSLADACQVFVANLAPVVDAGDDQAGKTGREIAINANVTDPGVDDIVLAVVAWGDGDSGVQPIDPVTGDVTPSHVYATAGTYIVIVTGVDNGGGFTVDTATITVTDPMPGDFNGDDQIDAADINLLFAARDGDDMLFDLNGDSEVNDADLIVLVRDIIGTYFGDANLDGQVNNSDYLTVALNWGGNGGWQHGDFNGDGVVNSADATTQAQNWMLGTTPSAAPAAPEAPVEAAPAELTEPAITPVVQAAETESSADDTAGRPRRRRRSALRSRSRRTRAVAEDGVFDTIGSANPLLARRSRR